MDKEQEEAAALEKEKEDAAAKEMEGLSDEEKAAKLAEDKKNTDNELELDKELEAERQKTADADKAREAFLSRQAKKKPAESEGEEKEVSEEDRPLTRRELAEMEARIEKRTLATQALLLARALASSDKEAEVIAAKWQNRTFPPGTSLQDQIEECYAITHRKKLVGERNEALRALQNKGSSTSTAAETHRDGPAAQEPGLPAADKQALAASGFVWDGAKRLYKKPLGRHGFLYRDPKSGQTFRAGA